MACPDYDGHDLALVEFYTAVAGGCSASDLVCCYLEPIGNQSFQDVVVSELDLESLASLRRSSSKSIGLDRNASNCEKPSLISCGLLLSVADSRKTGVSGQRVRAL